MSRSIWTQCAGSSERRRLALAAWRVVESQYVTSTRQLVDSDAEQEVLEAMLERVKPPLPTDPALARLHFLLSTPFRHPPLAHGSRFGSRAERGIWYGAVALSTVLAEVAYYRLVFLGGTSAALGTVTVEISAFTVAVQTRRGVDLTASPFSRFVRQISSPTGYDASQRLGAEMRADGIEAFLYVSARDPDRGVAVGLIAPAFTRRRPSAPETWLCTATHERVEFRKKDLLQPRGLVFPRAVFLERGVLPAPAL